MNSIIFIGIGVVVIVLLIVGLIVSVNSERSLVEERLGRFLDEDDKDSAAAGQEASRSIVTEWRNRRVASSSAGDRVARELARADLKFKVAEYYALVFISTLGLAVIAFLLQQQLPSLIIGAIVGFFLPR